MITSTVMTTPSAMASFSQGGAKKVQATSRRSCNIWAAGCQIISQSMAAQVHLEDAMAVWKAVGSVKSPKEAMDLNMGPAYQVLNIQTIEEC